MADPSVGGAGGITPGTTLLGDYRIERRLRADGFAATYLAVDLRLEREVTISEYLPREWAGRGKDGSVGPKSEDVAGPYATGLERFLASARLLAKADHPSIAKVHRIAEAHGTAYVVGERVQGRTLAESLDASGPMAPAAVRAILEGLVAGLAEVHALGLLHLDIRPANVRLRPTDSAAVLVGFGSARSAAPGGDASLWTVPKPGFAPIEQYSPSGSVGPWTDIYALGAVAYAALTGRTPMDAPGRVRRDALPDLRTAAAQPVEASLALAVSAAMRVDEAARPQDAKEWQQILQGGPPKAAARPAGSPARPVRRSRKGRRLFYAAGVTMVVAVAAIMVAMARNRTLTPEERAAAQEEQLGLGTDVVALVELGLSAEGRYSGEADGVLEPEARQGLREWQADRGIEATGYLDRASLTELLAVGREAEARLEADRIEAELAAEMERLTEERRSAQEERLEEMARLDSARRAEERRLAEEARLAEDERMAEEARREADRLAEEARQAEEARRAEAERLAEEARLEAERLEAARREEARRLEEERQEAERLEAARREAAERLANQEQRQAELLEAARRRADERLADNQLLLAARSALAGTTGNLNWRLNRDWESWTGVRTRDRNIVGLDLNGRNLGGVIPPRLASLSELEQLNLGGNRLTGAIPAQLGALRKLKALFLEDNQLSGQIPAELGSLSGLEDLHLYNNPLTGIIPPELGNLTSLKRLRLSRTRIAGRIPPELGRLQRIELLALSGNQLSGQIPPELGNLTNLRRLTLSNNRLSGCIPEPLMRFESGINPQQGGVRLPRCERP